MDEPEPTGDPKQDAFIASRTQLPTPRGDPGLTHIRAVQREQRIAACARRSGQTNRAIPEVGVRTGATGGLPAGAGP